MRRTEKGDKVLTSTDVLLLLEQDLGYVAELVYKLKPDEPVRELLSSVTSADFRAKFKTHYWGDVCA